MWLSASDLERGSRWSVDLATELGQSNIGIICLTQENLTAPWLLFEAGALSKALQESFVCTYLLDLEYTDVTGPLAQFQATRATVEDTRKLVETLNRASGGDAVPGGRLQKMFERWWPDLESRLMQARAVLTEPKLKPRSDRGILEELLTLQRRRTDTKLIASTVTRAVERAMTSINLVGQIERIISINTVVPRRSTAGRTPLDTASVEVDTRPLLHEDGSVLKYPIAQFSNVSDFLDYIYLWGGLQNVVPPHTYDIRWVLVNSTTGEPLHLLGRSWAASHGLNRDLRTLEEVGIIGDVLLEATSCDDVE